MKYEEIREMAGEVIKKNKIDDYRPAYGLYVDGLEDTTFIPNAIVCWLKNGDKIIYIAKERDTD